MVDYLKPQQLLLVQLRLGELRRHVRHGQEPRPRPGQRAEEVHLTAAHQVLGDVAVPPVVIQGPWERGNHGVHGVSTVCCVCVMQ